MSESSDEPTEPVDAVEETEPEAEPAPAEPAPAADDPVRTVTHKGATVAIAGALVVGGLAGWVASDAFGDDDDDDEGVPISAFQEGGGRFHRWGGGPMDGRGQGFPGGGFPGRPGGGWHDDGWQDDGERPPWMDERPDGDEDDDDGDDDRGTDEDEDQDEDPDDRETPSTTTEQN